MKFSLATAISSLALLSEFALAQTVQSKPFKLVTLSANKKYNNVGLFPCHEGAAIEGLCSGKSDTTFRVNTTQGAQSGVKGDSAPGLLTYQLPVQGGSIPESLGLYPDISSNVAIALFYPGADSQLYVSFDSKNLLNLQTYSNDTVSPPVDTKAYALYRWYVCTTNYSGYVYQTLAWVYGKAPPQNPSCVKVDVKRIFV